MDFTSVEARVFNLFTGKDQYYPGAEPQKGEEDYETKHSEWVKRCNKAYDVSRFYQGRVFQMYAPANAITDKANNLIVIKRLTDTPMAQYLCERSDILRRIRLQVEIWDDKHESFKEGTELIRNKLEKEFPSCVEDAYTEVDVIGATTWYVMSLDCILTEVNETAYAEQLT